MEERLTGVKLDVTRNTRSSIGRDTLEVSNSEYDLLLEYLAWIKDGKFSTFEASKYHHGESTYIDTTISDRVRHPLFQFKE